jgi:hypothetical protein
LNVRHAVELIQGVLNSRRPVETNSELLTGASKQVGKHSALHTSGGSFEQRPRVVFEDRHLLRIVDPSPEDHLMVRAYVQGPQRCPREDVALPGDCVALHMVNTGSRTVALSHVCGVREESGFRTPFAIHQHPRKEIVTLSARYPPIAHFQNAGLR